MQPPLPSRDPQGKTRCLYASLQQNKFPSPEAGPQQDPLPALGGFGGHSPHCFNKCFLKHGQPGLSHVQTV